ncbi:hypothetical protein CIB87_21330 [Priestia megaterium]|uniref:Uncharacterized protein n=1 Tax=Priestia megaterium TaxID=1404 RepID=A0AA86I3Y3_PRIMG|nr:hypothetical protein [Priestia megaterium]AXI31458.1 hypothetical protein CIB87_21330 [Priestia megaterium]
MTTKRMTGEEILLKQYSYQSETKTLVDELLEQGKTKGDIANELGIYVNEVTDISNEFKRLRKKKEKKKKKQVEEGTTTGNKVTDLFGNESLFEI